MRTTSVLLALLAAASLACDSGSPPIRVSPTSSGSVGVSAAVPVAPPPKDQRRLRSIKTVTLVEATGRGPESDAFVARLQSELSDRGIFTLADARLAGVSVGILASEPQGAEARAFKEAWPGEAYLAVSLGECFIKRSATPLSDHTPEGYRVDRTLITLDAECPASTRLIDAEDGHVLATVNVKGGASYKGDDAATGTTPAEEEAARDAATRTAKKLRSELAR